MANSSDSQDASPNNSGLAEPNKLPAMKIEEVKARAKLLFDNYGKAPYDPERIFGPNPSESQKAFTAVVSEFVYYWQPYFVEKKDA